MIQILNKGAVMPCGSHTGNYLLARELGCGVHAILIGSESGIDHVRAQRGGALNEAWLGLAGSSSWKSKFRHYSKSSLTLIKRCRNPNSLLTMQVDRGI
ncbi:hypothetical protein L873DRAFT_199900 [Choiromyces venosus 120613-1]|uniref:Uncharacterized protein n=1 Tax=Choiromyces venosus 120613-1 TaxID=1336337 RepID=A0A3N4J1T6_9PEZI|nr:hypothetical protein L873DRAFT_199900 [Choiromyces venosus 120613-1]